MGETRFETMFDVASKVGQLWEEVQNVYASRGKPAEGLYREVDQGFLADPLGIREFRNITGKIEEPEVLQWCYANEDCHPILVKHGYPVSFGMNDHDPDRWVDDQKQFEIQKEMDPLIVKSNGAGLKKTAEKIFEWSLEKMHFNGDCPVELAAWDALLQQCGACTEATSAVYFPFSTAGLHPLFYYEADWKPSLKWFERYEETGVSLNKRNQDHVLLGIPMEDKTVLFVDRINLEFAGDHPFALPLTPMNYSGLLMVNLVPDFFGNGDAEGGKKILQTVTELLPSDPFLYFDAILGLKAHGFMDQAEKMRGELVLLEHPARETLLELLSLEGRSFIEAVADENHPVRKKITGLETSHPKVASKLYFTLATLIAEQILGANKGRMVKAIQLAQYNQPVVEEFKQLAYLAVRLFAHSLRANPGAVKSYLGLSALLAQYGELIPVFAKYFADQIEDLLKQHPDHAALHLLAGKAAGLAANYVSTVEEGKKLLEHSLSHFMAMTELEPDHPLPYILSAKAGIYLNDRASAWPLLEKAESLATRPYPRQYYETLLFYAHDNEDAVKMKEVLSRLLEDRRKDGLEIAIMTLYQMANIPFRFTKKRVELEELQTKAVVENSVRMMAVAGEALENFPKARLALEEIQALQAVAVAFTQGKTAWRRIFLKINDGNRAETHRGFAAGLMLLDHWLSNRYQSEEVVDWVAAVLETVIQDLPRDLQGRGISISVELVNNYISLGLPRKAAVVLDRMMAMDSTQAVTSFSGRVISMKYDSWEKNLAALDILYDRREKIAPAVRQALAKGYEALLARVDAETKAEIRKKITGLM